MNLDFYQRLIDDHKELRSLPQTLSEVLRVSRDEKASAQSLAAVLGRDPALSAKILRVVNSPFYGLKRQVSSLTEAVIAVGTRAVSALALSTSVYDIANSWGSAIDRTRFWRHSLEVAIASRTIAEAIRYPRLEEAFVSGLLHDIGLLVLEKSFPDKFKVMWKRCEAGESSVDLEEKVWGTNHARVCQFLLEQWNLPTGICEAVGQHHHTFPPKLADPEFTLSQIVALANRVSRFTVVAQRPPTSRHLEAIETLRANLGLEPDRLAQIVEQLMRSTVEEAAFLEIEVGSTEDLLIEANRMLYRHYHVVESLLRENSSMQREIAQANLEKLALEALRTITATFNHYLNNAAATILGRAQLLEHAIARKQIVDSTGRASHALSIIINGVETIQLVLTELKGLNAYKTTIYHDDTHIIDIENNVRQHMRNLQALAEEQTPVRA